MKLKKEGKTKWTIRVPMRHCLTAEKGRKALQLGPRRPTMSQKFDLQAKIQPLCFVKIPNQKLFSYTVLLDWQHQPTQSMLYAPAHQLQLRSCLHVSLLKKTCFFKLMNKIFHLLVHCVLPCLACFEALLPSYCLPGQPAFVRKVCVAHICLRPCPYSSSKKYYKELKWVS